MDRVCVCVCSCVTGTKCFVIFRVLMENWPPYVALGGLDLPRLPPSHEIEVIQSSVFKVGR